MVRLAANHTGRVYYDSDEQRLLPGEDWPMLRERLERNWRRGARARMGVVGEVLPTPHAMLDQYADALMATADLERHARSVYAATFLDAVGGRELDEFAARLGVPR